MLEIRVSGLVPPPFYETPPFPSLYWPYPFSNGNGYYLYYPYDIWRFTLLWTLIVFALFHLAAVALAMCMRLGKGSSVWKYIWIIPLAYAVIASVQALFAGSIVGLILGAVYNSGYFQMSTWIPFVWSLISILVLILSSFSIQGGL